MPDKITMINLVWMTMITGMLTVTATLYQGKNDSSTPSYSYSEMTSRYQHLNYY